jgi:hypothetical protein
MSRPSATTTYIVSTFGTLDPSVVASTSAASFQHDFRNGAVYYYSEPHGVNIHACYAAYADFLNHL